MAISTERRCVNDICIRIASASDPPVISSAQHGNGQQARADQQSNLVICTIWQASNAANALQLNSVGLTPALEKLP